MLSDHASGVLENHGADVVSVDLEALNLPLYDPNLEEQNFPANAQAFKDQLTEAGTFVIVQTGQQETRISMQHFYFVQMESLLLRQSTMV